MTLTTLCLAFASFGLLAFVFAALERAFPARPGQRWLRPEWRIDACFFFGQYLVWSAVAAFALGFVHRATNAHVPAGLRSAFLAQPFWVQAIEAVVLGDVLVYWFHRACHRFDVLWRFHAVHHSAEHLDWLAAHREHPLDGLCTQLCQNLPAFVLGLRLNLLAPLIVLRGAWGIFIHSNVKIRLGPIGMLLGAPDLHHFHHARRGPLNDNFANLAPWLDVLFGTYRRPVGEETYPLGLSEPWPRGYVAQLLRPFARRELVRAEDRLMRPSALRSTEVGSHCPPSAPSVEPRDPSVAGA